MLLSRCLVTTISSTLLGVVGAAACEDAGAWARAIDGVVATTRKAKADAKERHIGAGYQSGRTSRGRVSPLLADVKREPAAALRRRRADRFGSAARSSALVAGC